MDCTPIPIDDEIEPQCLNRICNQDCKKCKEVQKKSKKAISIPAAQELADANFKKLWNEVETNGYF